MMTIDTEPRMAHYRVHLRSAPGMWASYDGHVEFWERAGLDDQEAFRAAVQQLARTSFADRPSMASWRLDGVEVLPE